MSHIAHHPIFALSGQLVARALRVFKNRRQMGKLSELSDAALKDIGLTRSDVRRAIALPVHTDPVPFLTQMANGHCTRRTAAHAPCRQRRSQSSEPGELFRRIPGRKSQLDWKLFSSPCRQALLTSTDPPFRRVFFCSSYLPRFLVAVAKKSSNALNWLDCRSRPADIQPGHHFIEFRRLVCLRPLHRLDRLRAPAPAQLLPQTWRAAAGCRNEPQKAFIASVYP
jgi:uncharacterized protein YjiS (DUF1127 family)